MTLRYLIKTIAFPAHWEIEDHDDHRIYYMNNFELIREEYLKKHIIYLDGRLDKLVIHITKKRPRKL